MTPSDHARRSDPRSSDRTVTSIVKDPTLADLIVRAFAWRLANTAVLRVRKPSAACDTWLWQWIEDFTGRRHQRNVIARARGRLVEDGVLVGIGEREYEGVMLNHYVLAPVAGAPTDPNTKEQPDGNPQVQRPVPHPHDGDLRGGCDKPC